jgi:hypothetical protein
MAAVASQLRAALPEDTPAGAVVPRLQSPAFHSQLKAALDAGVQLASAALAPRLPAVAAAVHDMLAGLVAQPSDVLQPLPAFAEGFLPGFASSFSLSIVEATLLRTLWQEA